MALSADDQGHLNQRIGDQTARVRSRPPAHAVQRTVKPVGPRPPAAPARKTSFIPGQHIDGIGVWAQRVLGVLLLTITFVGTLSAVNPGGMSTLIAAYRAGGWLAVGAATNTTALWFALFVQVVLTLTEWYQRHHRATTSYRVALLIDIGLTAWGWGPYVAPSLSHALASISPLLSLATWPIIIYGAFEAARLPERIIID